MRACHGGIVATSFFSMGWSPPPNVLMLPAFYKQNGRSSPSCDGPQWAGSKTAIESVWRCIFVKIRPSLWSLMAPWSFLASQGRPWGVSGTSLGVPGACAGVPGASRGNPGVCPGVPGAFSGVPGAYPGDPQDPRGLRGRPGHPQDPFHKDESVV